MHLTLYLAIALLGGSVNALKSTTTEDYIATESPIAKRNVLNNIGPPVGALPGVVSVASSNNTDPSSKFTWIRDSAMVMKSLINEFTLGLDTSLRDTIETYLLGQYRTQLITNPSGTVSTGGLAEPRFNFDYTADTTSFSRPENDGPPLRANNLITYANWLVDEDKNTTFVENVLWPSISLDIDYILHHWNETSFELWEIAWTESYWTAAVEVHALRSAAILGRKIGRDYEVKGWESTASVILSFMQSFWNNQANYVSGNTIPDRSGIDSSTVLASIYNYDPLAGCDSLTLQPCSDRALMNLKAVVDGFRPLYPINSKTGAAAVGLWTEDTVFGSPWHLSTFGVAEQLYDALAVWNQTSSITVTTLSLPFFQQFFIAALVITYRPGFIGYQEILDGVKAFADNTILIAANYTPQDGMLPQMFDKEDGKPLGANGLSWSYSAALSAFDARNGLKPASWGAQGLAQSCTCGGLRVSEDAKDLLQVTEKLIGEEYLQEKHHSKGLLHELPEAQHSVDVFSYEEAGFLERMYKTAAEFFQRYRGYQEYAYHQGYEITEQDSYEAPAAYMYSRFFRGYGR